MIGSGTDFGLTCPIPQADYPNVLLAHGGGGKLTGDLVDKLFLPAFDNPQLELQHDGAVIDLAGTRVAFSTDSYVVQPLFFPGGDIGSMAVNGTVNDLAMCGARPLYLSCGFIIEEGLPMETLWRVTESMRRAAEEAGVQLVTGDTKVVDRGKGDGLFINTAGVGLVANGVDIAPGRVRGGDLILLSGDVGRHGIAIMAEREGLGFESEIASDCACVADMVQELLRADVRVHCMRDLTRGGLATALVEIAEKAKRPITIDETVIPIADSVRGACEILGLDPLYVANEGRFLVIVDPLDADRALELLRSDPQGSQSARIGEVGEDGGGLVTVRGAIGAERLIDRLSGEQLPRIC